MPGQTVTHRPARDATAVALVTVRQVSIVAGLVAVLTRDEVRADDTVAAGGERAVVTACVGVDVVAVVASLLALFAFCEVGAVDAVAAARQLAVVVAAIVGDDVPVIRTPHRSRPRRCRSCSRSNGGTFITHLTVVGLGKIWSDRLAVLFGEARWVKRLEVSGMTLPKRRG